MPPKPPKHPKTQKILPSGPNQSLIPYNIQPIVRRFFYVSKSDVNLSDTQIIYARMFTNDEGNSVTNLPNIGKNGYANLYINGLLQEGYAYSITVNALTIKSIGGTIYANTPIIIEVVEFCISLT